MDHDIRDTRRAPSSRPEQSVRLWAHPESLSQETFEALCEELHLSLADIEPLVARRAQHNIPDALERHALLALLSDDEAEAERLVRLMEQRTALRLRVI
jgi:hypothetical protein